MRELLSILFFLVIGITTKAQTAQFAWMAGTTFSNSVGPWGTKGVGSATNAVSSRENAQQWTDNSGNFWVFGGNGHASTFNLGRLSDMWKYDVTLGEWTWVSGTSLMNQNGIYGTKSLPSATNNPGGRSQGVTFVDNAGNLWLFGGLGNDVSGNIENLNDLWRFNTTTKEWTWITGSNTVSAAGVYGTLGVGSTTNTPGARSRSVSWVDANGNFWLYGGYGFASNAFATELSDLWKFNPTTLEWTWVSGSNVAGALGVYGTKGVPSTANKPGSRGNASSFKDLSGNLWLFGGAGHATAATIGKLNDLWRFNPTTSEWTWMSGSNALGVGNTFGVKGTPALTNVPGGRDESAYWTDNSGNFWLLGGHGKDASNGFDNELNDLWMYHVTNNTWTYVAGSTAALQSGVYGTKSVLSSTNIIGARQRASSFKDSNGDLWLFAGYGKPSVGTGYLSDWWKIKTCYTSLAATTTPSANLVICAGATTSLSASGTGNLGWYSAVSGGIYLGGGANYSTPTLTANTTYYVQDSTCGAGPRVAITITVNALPTLTVAGTNTICNGGTGTISVTGTPLSYTWNTGATATSISVSPSITTVYTVTGTDINGCVNNKTKTLTVYALPSLTITGGITMCSGQGTILSASGANSFTWSTGSTANGFVANPSVTTTYTVTGKTTSTGCINTQTATVTISTPTVVITGSTSVCKGTIVNLIAGGASTYTWSTGTQSTNINVTPTVTTIYTVSAKDAFGCNGSDTHTITVLQTPTVSITGNSVTCLGTPITLTANGASTYTWNSGSLNTVETFTPSSLTIYSVTGVDGNGCLGSSTKTVSINALPTLSISGANVLCFGSSVNLNVTGASSYTWNTSSTSSSISISPTVTTNYSVIGKAANTCTNSANTTVTVNALPVLTIYGNSTICSGSPTSINVSGANTFTWSNASNSPTITVTPSITTTYSVIGKDLNNCTNTAVQTITVNPLPVVIANATTSSVCIGSNVTLTGAGASTYTWTNGVIDGVSFTPSTTASYAVSGTDLNGCVNSAPLLVTVNNLPNVTANSTSTLACLGDNLVLTGGGASTYTWTGSVSDGTPFIAAASDSYTVTGVDANGCINTATVSISVNICTGIQQLNANSNSVLVFPNPSNGVFIIQSQKADAIAITNELGQVLELVELNLQNNFTYHVEYLQCGIYFLVGKTIKQKVVVSK